MDVTLTLDRGEYPFRFVFYPLALFLLSVSKKTKQQNKTGSHGYRTERPRFDTKITEKGQEMLV